MYIGTQTARNRRPRPGSVITELRFRLRTMW